MLESMWAQTYVMTHQQSLAWTFHKSYHTHFTRFYPEEMLYPTNLNHCSTKMGYLSHPWISNISISEAGPKLILKKEVILLVDTAVSLCWLESQKVRARGALEILSSNQRLYRGFFSSSVSKLETKFLSLSCSVQHQPHLPPQLGVRTTSLGAKAEKK